MGIKSQILTKSMEIPTWTPNTPQNSEPCLIETPQNPSEAALDKHVFLMSVGIQGNHLEHLCRVTG